MTRILSLDQIVETEASRLGLKTWEVVNLIEKSIQKRYLRQGRNVHVRINLESDEEPLVALECKESQSGLVWVDVPDIRPPHPDTLQREMEEYVKRKAGDRNWWLAVCLIIMVENDHYIVEVETCDEAGLIGKTAVLPLNRLSKMNRDLQRGASVMAVLTQKSRATYDGAEDWVKVGTDYVASRTDSIFLKLLVRKYWHVQVEADITNGAGLVTLPIDANLGAIIGPNGSFIEQLKEISGLSRIVIARSVAGKRPDLRLTHAIRQVVGIEGVRVRPPAKDSDEWRLKVSSKDAPILIGTNGTNLRFISVLAGLRIKFDIRDSR